MKLTSQEEYGLRCLLQIAAAPAQFLTIPEVARREALSTAYVAKLMRLLRRSGFVRSVRGQNGGFELAIRASEINVGAVLDALGGRLYSQAFCQAHAGDRCECVHSRDCSLRPLWTALDGAIQNVLNRTQLSHLIHGQCHMETWLHESAREVSASGLQSVPHASGERMLQNSLQHPLQDALASDNPVAITKRNQGPQSTGSQDAQEILLKA